MTILIASHSNAYDIWHITNHFLNKHWKGDLNIYLGANGENKKEFCPKKWIYINKGEDESFSKSLKSYLDEIEDEYFMLMLDDFLILENVDNDLIKRAFDFIKKNNGVYLRLTPNPKGDKKIDKYFSYIDVENKVPYITSLQMAIWKKDFLKALLEYDFNPWEFEVKAGKTKESLKCSDKFFVTNLDFVNYTHFVEKGKFYPFIKKLVEKENLYFISDREFWSEENLKKFNDPLFKRILRNIIPNKYKNSLRKFIGKEEL